jgi:hypothetical protein
MDAGFCAAPLRKHLYTLAHYKRGGMGLDLCGGIHFTPWAESCSLCFWAGLLFGCPIWKRATNGDAGRHN